MAQADRLVMRIVPFAGWRREIAPLWLMEGAAARIGRVLGGHGQLRYVGEEIARRVLLFPIAAELDGRRVGWTSTYNISDEAIRLRGIYGLPECRAMGVGRRLAAFAESLWPPPWRSCFIYAREANVPLYRRWGFDLAPGHAPRSTDLDRALPGLRVVLMTREIARGVAELARQARTNPNTGLEPSRGSSNREEPS
jgi:GNAT superfamily N-acetyltransferase